MSSKKFTGIKLKMELLIINDFSTFLVTSKTDEISQTYIKLESELDTDGLYLLIIIKFPIS
jgi:hypothetical protein